MHRIVIDNLVAVSEQIVSSSKSSLSRNCDTQATIKIFKAWKIILATLKHALFKTTKEKITKVGIFISYSVPVSSLETAESLRSEESFTPDNLIFFSRQLGHYKALPLTSVQDQELHHFTNTIQSRRLPLSLGLLILSETIKKTGELLGSETYRESICLAV